MVGWERVLVGQFQVVVGPDPVCNNNTQSATGAPRPLTTQSLVRVESHKHTYMYIIIELAVPVPRQNPLPFMLKMKE